MHELKKEGRTTEIAVAKLLLYKLFIDVISDFK